MSDLVLAQVCCRWASLGYLHTCSLLVTVIFVYPNLRLLTSAAQRSSAWQGIGPDFSLLQFRNTWALFTCVWVNCPSVAICRLLNACFNYWKPTLFTYGYGACSMASFIWIGSTCQTQPVVYIVPCCNCSSVYFNGCWPCKLMAWQSGGQWNGEMNPLLPV